MGTTLAVKGLASCNWYPLAIIVYSHFVTFESGRALNEKLANRGSLDGSLHRMTRNVLSTNTL